MPRKVGRTIIAPLADRAEDPCFDTGVVGASLSSYFAITSLQCCSPDSAFVEKELEMQVSGWGKNHCDFIRLHFLFLFSYSFSKSLVFHECPRKMLLQSCRKRILSTFHM